MNLRLGDHARPHLDIFEKQLAAKIEQDRHRLETVREEDGESSASAQNKNSEKKHLDWRESLKSLQKDDLKYVDGMAKYMTADINEDDALNEDLEYLSRLSNFEKKKKRKRHAAGYILLEAKEADDFSEESDGETSNAECEDVYPVAYGIPQPDHYREGCHRVPGLPPVDYREMIDGKIHDMACTRHVQNLLDDCLNWQKECNDETLKLVQSEKKFCIHENDEGFKKRMEIYSKANPEEKSSALRQFALYILQPKFRNSVFLGMYSSGFDNHFVFSELVSMGVRVEPIYRGNKLITFKIPFLNIRFLDFFCFVPSSLKNLEKSFNLTTGSKGYFPHLLNHPKHYGLELPHLPPKMFYEPELMKNEDLKSFEKWYSENSNKPFKFSQELLTYCELDVKILLAASLTFVKETLIQQTEFKGTLRKLQPNGVIFEFKCGTRIQPNLVHPFSKDVCTLSSYANVLFRSYYLPKNYLPIITHDVEETYSARSSKEELEYMSYLKKSKQITDLEFGNEFRGQRQFNIFCDAAQKTRTFCVDGYSPSKKVKYN